MIVWIPIVLSIKQNLRIRVIYHVPILLDNMQKNYMKEINVIKRMNNKIKVMSQEVFSKIFNRTEQPPKCFTCEEIINVGNKYVPHPKKGRCGKYHLYCVKDARRINYI
jgi:hypothetical protein